MAEPTSKQLLEKLSGKRLFLSTRCGTLSEVDGIIQQVYSEFVLFLTKDERQQDDTSIRNWVWIDNIAVVTEAVNLKTEELEIER